MGKFSSLERRIRALEARVRIGTNSFLWPRFFFLPKDPAAWDEFESNARAECKTMKPARAPNFIEFIGPDGGEELGTGPFSDTDSKDEEFSDYDDLQRT